MRGSRGSPPSYPDHSGTHLLTMPNISNTTQELFRIWLDGCLKGFDEQDRANSSTNTSVDQDSVSTTTTQPFNNTTTTNPRHSITLVESTNKLRREAAAFFRSLVRDTTIITTTGHRLATKASHQEALAVLIQQLGPAFSSSSLVVRLRALSCLRGAVEGSRKEKTSFLDKELVNVLGKFWLQYAGPYEDDNKSNVAMTAEELSSNVGRQDYDEEDDIDEKLRDEAVEGLTVLVGCRMEPSLECVPMCLSFARSGVQRRCAESEHSPMSEFEENALTMGLSTLPRSRRSLCFQLLQSAVDTVARMKSPELLEQNTSQYEFLQKDMVSFAQFSARCLRGESDPRCLTQLLSLLHNIMIAWKPFFGAHCGKLNFPLVEFFDATAPYYPIQFTPPPNNVFGITKEGLRQSLMNVLMCCDYDRDVLSQGQHAGDTMMSLSLNLVLDRLVPPPEDEPATMDDWREGLADLDLLLFNISSSKPNLTVLPAENMRQVALAFDVIHHQASMAVATKTGVEAEIAKETANSCRDIIAKVARESEHLESPLWKLFVGDPLSRLAAKLDSSSSAAETRVAIAYAASLCSCGGHKSMNAALKTGLGGLLKRVDTIQADDDDDVATAVYGVGAFFSATLASLEKSRKEGIDLHPHPLEPYASNALRVCHLSLSRGKASSQEIAAVRALETILVASPVSLFQDDMVETACEIVELLVAVAIEKVHDQEAATEFKETCARSLGFLLGKALEDSGKDSETYGQPSLLHSASSQTFLRTRVLDQLIGSVKSATNGPRWARLVLAEACKNSLATSSIILQPLAEGVKRALCECNHDLARLLAETLECAFCQEESYAPRAFQLMKPPSVTFMDLRMSLCSSFARDVGEKSNETMLHTVIDQALSISLLLKSIFNRVSLPTQVDALCTAIDEYLPPGGNVGTMKFSLDLCFLSAALKRLDAPLGSDFIAKLHRMEPYMIDFALSRSLPPSVRSFAVECLHDVALTAPSDSDCCRIVSMVADKISKIGRNGGSPSKVVAELGDLFSILGILGNVAYQRGFSAAATADQILNFLADLACNRQAHCSFTNEPEQDLDFSSVSDSSSGAQVSEDLVLCAATGIGAMFTGRGREGIWKQRLTHVAAKKIIDAWQTRPQVSQGVIASTCHVLCGGSLSSLPDSNLETLTKAALVGLTKDAPVGTPSTLKLVLVSLLKVMSLRPQILNDFAYVIVTGSLRSFALADTFATGEALACKLLALQLLEASTTIAVPILPKVRPPVVSILAAAVNHPSTIVRQAAVHVRNTWLLLD